MVHLSPSPPCIPYESVGNSLSKREFKHKAKPKTGQALPLFLMRWVSPFVFSLVPTCRPTAALCPECIYQTIKNGKRYIVSLCRLTAMRLRDEIFIVHAAIYSRSIRQRHTQWQN